MGVKKYLFTIFAVTALAFIGAGTASATVLCNEAASKCKSYVKGVTVDAALTESATFSTTSGTVLDTCTFGTREGTISNAGGTSATVSETIGDLSWGSCTGTTDTISKGELEIHWISGTNNGTVTGKNISITANTGFGSCTYGTGAAADIGTIEGGKPATIKINAILNKVEGGVLCPADVKAVAGYSVESPQPLFVGESSSALAPNIKIENTGLIPAKGTSKCVFAKKGDICEIKVTNLNVGGVEVKAEAIFERVPEGRFELVAKCGVGTVIVEGGSCIAKVKLLVVPAAGWNNGYQISIEPEAGGGATLFSAFLTT
jgi:hypothetical protein